MAIYFTTETPRALLKAFNDAVDQGDITTWERDSDGDYTHKAQDWKKKLWLTPTPETHRLAFYTIPPSSKKIARKDFAYYHGHLIETFLNHFPKKFDLAQATPNADGSDKVG
jgi:hypothetical protein